MSFPRYPKYKASGVEWLGDVPEGWEVAPLKFVATYNDDVIDETTPPDTEILYVDISAVDALDGIKMKQPMLFGAAPSRARRRVKHGDTIVSTVRTYLRAIARVRTPEENLIVSTGFAVIRPRADLSPDYVGNVLSASYFIEQVIARSTGVGYPAINASDLARIPVAIPPLPEQTAIAEFLDRETGKIDELVAEQRRLMELLKEKRQAVISHAVTGKGEVRRMKDENGRSYFILQPSSLPKKPSGIEWLGEVPEHWEVMSLRRCKKRIQTGGTPPTADQSYYEDGTVPWFGPGSFDENLTVSEPIKWLNESAVKEGVARVFAAGATMIVTIGATLGKVSSLVEDGSCNQQITVIEFDPRRVCARFATYQIKRLEPALRAIAPSATLPILGLGEVADIDMVIPPLVDQVAIVAHLDAELAKFDDLTAEAQRAIDLLQERRTALISAAVTGQIDVRGAIP